MSPFDSAKAKLRVKINQIAALINPSTPLRANPSASSGLVLEATHRESERSVEAAHEGTAAEEVEAARVSATNRTAPIVAVGTDIAERTIAEAAAARHGQFKW